MDTLHLRKALPHDAAAIASIEAAAASGPWSEDAVRRTLAQRHTLGWVAGRPVVAHLLATQVGDEGEILTLAVRPEARRRGLARALLAALEQRWRAHGLQTGWLEVRADNDAARALYASLGWTSAGRRRGYYDDGIDAIIMRWMP